MECSRRKWVGGVLRGCVGSWIGSAFGTLSAGSLVSCVDNESGDSRKHNSRFAVVHNVRTCAEHEGCDLCVAACHRRHNVPDFGEGSPHAVRWVQKESFERVFALFANRPLPAHIRTSKALVLCNHCDNPPCVRVCPTGATWKANNGIVMMDYHRCLGCRYCAVACPYGARSFNWVDPRPNITSISSEFPTRKKGVVEKCTLCADRLARSLKPVCVEACPYGALLVGDLSDPDSDVTSVLSKELTNCRKPELGTQPQVYYVL